MTTANSACRVIVVSPVYDDAEAASRVVRELHEAAAREKLQLRVVLVDDGSPIPLTQQLQIAAGCPVEVIRLKRNVGHQRAIALGISYVQENEQCPGRR